MGLETNTDVEEMRRVQAEDGSRQAPANERRQKQVEKAVGNHDGLTQFVYTTTTDSTESLESHAVPDGVEVLVEYKETNSGNVYVGDADTQEAALTGVGDGRTFRVSDTSLIHVRAPTAGDEVVVTFEVDG